MNKENDFMEAEEAPDDHVSDDDVSDDDVSDDVDRGERAPDEETESESAPASAGETLRAARDRRRMTLETIAAETRIPKRHLETIEAGRFEDLPSRTYAIGFARTYARVVNLDESAIADQVREELGAAGPRYPSRGQGMEPGDPAKVPSRGLAIFGGIAALILLLGVISFAGSYYGAGEAPASLLDTEEVEREEMAQLDAGDAAPAASADAQVAPAADGQVIFTALEDGVWVRFYEAGGERFFEAKMSSGETFEVPQTANEPRINTGRPDAFAITIDGKEVPKLAEEPMTIGDAPISAAALLARARS